MSTSQPTAPRASLLYLAMLVNLNPTAQAQTRSRSELNPQQAANEVGRVSVFGERTPLLPAHGVDISPRSLRAQRGRSDDAAALLEAVPGVQVQQAGGTSGLPVIHGMADDRNKVLVDGVESIASCPNHMNPPLSYIDPTQVATVRVFAGITPVSMGGDSIGGSIVVNARAAEFAKPGEGWNVGGEVGAAWRSNGGARSADLHLHAGNDWLNLRYGSTFAQAGNYRAGGDFHTTTATGVQGHEIPRDEVASSGYRLRTHLLGLGLKLGAHRIDLQLGRQDVPHELYPNQRMDMLGNHQRRLNLRYVGEAEFGDVQAAFSREWVRHRMDFGPDKQFWYGAMAAPTGASDSTVPCAPLGPTCAAGMPMNTRSITTAFSFGATLKLQPQHALRMGAELQRYRLDDWWPPSGGSMWPAAFWNIRDGRRHRTSFYLEWEGHFGTRYTALLGARVGRVTTSTGLAAGYDPDPAPPGSWAMTAADAARFNAGPRQRTDTLRDVSALLRYTPNTHVDVELGLTHKERAPNLYERYAWSTWTMAAVMNNFAGDGNGYVGDPALRPERANTVAATFDVHGRDADWGLRVAPYVTRVHGYIDALALTHYGAHAFNLLRFANQEALLRGVDVAAHAVLARRGGQVFEATLTASAAQGRNLTRHDGLYNQMPPNLMLTLGHRGGGWDNAMEWRLVERKARVSNLRNEATTAGYGLLNLRSSWAWRWLRLDGGIDNVLDKHYALPLGGTYVAQGRTMGINAIAHGIAVPGPGRSLRFGVHVSF